ncbi:MAG: dockerin type I repeat-containing protein, partial [bacterium]
PDLTYHIYRRAASSDGSFFRRDDPDGLLANPGVAGGEFVDTGVVADIEYDYLLIAEDPEGRLGIHSGVLDTGVQSYICGDADSDGIANITDAIYIIQYIFAEGPPPQPSAAGDVDLSGAVNITDAVYLIQWIFNSGPVPCEACP